MRNEKQWKDSYIYRYYDDINNGLFIVGKWIRLIYKYLIEGVENGLFFYDSEKANNAVDWIETHCFHVEGRLGTKNLKLELWQKAFVATIFGIVDKDGFRQFREIVLIVGRKNGKSLLMSAICRYLWLVDGGFGARVYCLAPKSDQSKIIYNSIWTQTTLDPEWIALKEAISSEREANHRAVDDSELARHTQTSLFLPCKNSTVEKVSYLSKDSNGYNPSITICDEIASWEGDRGLKVYDVMKSAMGAREEGLIISCSTAGYVNESIYDELIKRSTRFLLGDSKEKRLLPLLYMVDDAELWNDLNELRKSNPNMNISVPESYFEDEIAIAETSLPKRAEFLTKYCNVKQNSSQAWLESKVVESACGKELRLEDFRSSYAICGIDLSQTTDLTSATAVIEKNGELYVFNKMWLPSEKIDEATARDGLPYNIYIQRGLLEPSGENYVDYHDCYRWMTDLVEKYEILPLVVGYDRYSAQYLVQDLSTYGFKTDDVYQGDNLWGVLQEAEGLLKDGKIHIGNNDLLKVHMLNSAIKFNAQRGRGRLVKMSPSDHIDGMASLVDALCVRQKFYGELGERLKN